MRVAGQREDRLGIAGAERPGALDRVDQLGGWRRPRVTAPSIEQRAVAPRRLDAGRERLLEIGAELAERAVPQREARRHGVAAALDQQALGHRLAHRAAEIDAGDRAARAGAGAARLERDGERRPTEPLLQPRRDQPDDAGMPAGARR